MSNVHHRRGRNLLVCLPMAMLGATQAAVVAPPAGTVVDGVAAASVFEQAANGLGHINIVPMYTVGGGFDTYLNLTNTDTRNGKAVKLRFLAAGAGDTVFNMMVLLSPGDRWAAALTLDSTSGLPRLVHNDRSCTLPADVQKVFNTQRLYGPVAPQAARTGSVEIITVADIPPRTAANDPPLFQAIQQVAGVAPCTVSALEPLASDSVTYAQAQAKGLQAPTTGLMTRWTLIHVPRALSFTGVATALEARVAPGGAAGFGNVVLFPQTDTPVASLAAVRGYTADPLLRGGVPAAQVDQHPPIASYAPIIVALQNDLPDLSTPYLPAGTAASNPQPGAAPRLQAYAVGKAMAVSSIANEFVVEPLIAGRTEWIFTMPTRRYEVAVNWNSPDYNQMVFTDLSVDDLGNALGGSTASLFPRGKLTYLLTGNAICYNHYDGPSIVSPIAPAAFNRTGTVYGDQEAALKTFRQPDLGGVSPSDVLCGQTGILKPYYAFGATTAEAIFQSQGAYIMKYGLAERSGWFRFATPGATNAGLPIIGFAAMELFNAAAMPGMAGSYGQTFPHTTTRPD